MFFVSTKKPRPKNLKRFPKSAFLNFSTVAVTLGFGVNLDVVLDIRVIIARPFGLRVKLHVPLFGGLNFFLKLRAVAPFKPHVQQRMLNQALFPYTENFVQQRFARYFSIVLDNVPEAPRFVFVAHYN
jgi:hypothetical protein